MNDEKRAQVLTICPDCIGAGELIALTDVALLYPCPKCDGSGRLTIACPAEQAAHVAVAAVRAITQRARTHAAAMLDGAGLCLWCFGSKRMTWIERDENNRPIQGAETDCPMCSARSGQPGAG